MNLYHYATWSGEQINTERVIQPSLRYANWVKQTLLDQWPTLTFLTLNPDWEPSIQSFSREGHWEKCGSLPETNAALGIPCWRFQINPNGLILGMATDFRGCSNWQKMLDDATLMGSAIDDWRIAVQDCYVIEAWQWKDDEWTVAG